MQCECPRQAIEDWVILQWANKKQRDEHECPPNRSSSRKGVSGGVSVEAKIRGIPGKCQVQIRAVSHTTKCCVVVCATKYAKSSYFYVLLL